MGVRGKLFVVYAGIILTAVVVSGVFLEVKLRQSLEQRTESELHHQAEATRVLLDLHMDSGSEQSIADLTDDIGAAADSRITIIAEDGRVLGDSQIGAAGVSSMVNHADRPEFIAALEQGYGVSRRFSTTLRTRMLYVAIPDTVAGAHRVVRVSKPLSEVEQAVADLRFILAIAGLAGLAIALVMSGVASHLVSKTFRDLVQSARATAEAGGESGISPSRKDEIGTLALSLSQMQTQLEHLVSELAAERDRFETVLESMLGAVLAIDRDGSITLVNSAARKLLGGEDEESVLGRTLAEVIDAPALHDLIAALPSQGPSTAEFELLGTSRRYLSANASPLRAGSGAVVVIHDVTEIRRLEAIRRDFVANASHELRPPVSIIRAGAEN